MHMKGKIGNKTITLHDKSCINQRTKLKRHPQGKTIQDINMMKGEETTPTNLPFPFPTEQEPRPIVYPRQLTLPRNWFDSSVHFPAGQLRREKVCEYQSSQ